MQPHREWRQRYDNLATRGSRPILVPREMPELCAIPSEVLGPGEITVGGKWVYESGEGADVPALSASLIAVQAGARLGKRTLAPRRNQRAQNPKWVARAYYARRMPGFDSPGAVSSLRAAFRFQCFVLLGFACAQLSSCLCISLRP